MLFSDLSNNRLTGELPQSLLNMVSIQNMCAKIIYLFIYYSNNFFISILSNNLLSGNFPFAGSLFNINVLYVYLNV